MTQLFRHLRRVFLDVFSSFQFFPILKVHLHLFNAVFSHFIHSIPFSGFYFIRNDVFFFSIILFLPSYIQSFSFNFLYIFWFLSHSNLFLLFLHFLVFTVYFLCMFFPSFLARQFSFFIVFSSQWF